MSLNFNIKKIIAIILIFSVAIFSVDFLLSFAGLEKYDKNFSSKSSNPIFVEGKGDLSGYYVTNSHFKDAINFQYFPIKKSKGVTRIFVIGGSAAFAWPYTEEFGFSGYLRRAFDEILPGKFEVINAAGMSYGSHRVYDVLEDVINLDPDLVIVFSCNNEYIERNVIPKLKRNSVLAKHIGEFLGKSHLYRAVRLCLFWVAPSVFSQKAASDLTDLRSDSVVSRGALGRSSEIDKEVFGNFKTNITNIVELLSDNHVKSIFVTAPVNIVNYRPTNAPMLFSNINESVRWYELQNEVVDIVNNQITKLNNSDKVKKLNKSVGLLVEMSQITSENPWIYFTLGKVYALLNQYDNAYVNFVKAKDLDARPIRELSVFNEALRDIVNQKKGSSNNALFDFEEVFSAKVRKGEGDWFLDYCHLNEEGHKSLAIGLVPFIQKTLGINFNSGRMIMKILTDSWGNNKDQKIINILLFASGATNSHNYQYEKAEHDFLAILNNKGYESAGLYPSSVYRALSYVYQGLGDMERSRSYLLKAIEVGPDDYEALISGGLLFIDEGDLQRAEDMLKKSLLLNEYSPLSFEGLGRIYLIRGFPKDAVLKYEAALRLGYDSLPLRKGLGQAYIAVGEVDKAIVSWQKALQFDYSDSEVSALLKKHSSSVIN